MTSSSKPSSAPSGNGKVPVPGPAEIEQARRAGAVPAPPRAAAPAKAEAAGRNGADAPAKAKGGPAQKDGEKRAKAEARAAQPAEDGKLAQANVSQLDMRVGRIVDVRKHPDADALYVESVDLGEAGDPDHCQVRARRGECVGEPRSSAACGCVRGVAASLSTSHRRDGEPPGLFLVNLKPAKMRGVESQGMIMCANSGDKVRDAGGGRSIGDARARSPRCCHLPRWKSSCRPRA